MDLGDFIYTIMTLFILLLFMVAPLIKKALTRRRRKNRAEEPRLFPEQSALSQRAPKRTQWEPEGFQRDYSPSKDLQSHKIPEEDRKTSAMERIEKMPTLKRAVIWNEILSKPVGLREER